MMQFSKHTVLAAGVATAFLAFAPATSQAGFQWTAPAAGVAAAPAVSSAPVPPVTTENLMGGNAIRTTPDGPASAAPIYGQGMTDDPITWNTPMTGRNMQAAQQGLRAPQQPQNVLPQGSSMMQQSQQMQAPQYGQQPTNLYALEATPSGFSSYETADGFGQDLPLVMAIRQIVPASFGFVFDDGIDLNSRVSWQGGKPWDLVLRDTLTPLGLDANIRGNVVSISRASVPMQSTGLGTLGGPVVMSDTVTNATNVPMTPTPVAMLSSPADDMMAGGYMGTPAAATAASLTSNTTWTAPRNSTLRGILEDWSERVGVELYWASEYDYPIKSAVSIQGTFEEAVQTLLKGLTESRPRPLGRLHPNLPDGPAVLVIETRQNSM